DASVSGPPSPARSRLVLSITVAVLLLTFITLLLGLPSIDTTANALRPRKSPAYTTLDEIQAHLNQKREPLWLIIGGESVTEIGQRVHQLQAVLSRATSNELLAGFTLPTPLWPRPEFQAENRPIARQLSEERPLLRQAAQA